MSTANTMPNDEGRQAAPDRALVAQPARGAGYVAADSDGEADQSGQD